MTGLVHIIDNWLRHFVPEADDQRQTVQLFHKQLQLITSLPELRQLLEDYQKPSLDHRKALFNKKIDDWLVIAVKIESAWAMAQDSLSELAEANVYSEILAFCNVLFARNHSFLHCQILSVLNVLINIDQLQQTLAFVYDLPHCQRRENPQSGSFEALTPEDTDHAHLIQLLLNNAHYLSLHSHSLQKSSELAHRANGLLQNLLKMREDTKTDLAPLLDIIWTFPSEPSAGVSCILC